MFARCGETVAKSCLYDRTAACGLIWVTNHLTNVAAQTDYYPTARSVSSWEVNPRGPISWWDMIEFSASELFLLLGRMASTEKRLSPKSAISEEEAKELRQLLDRLQLQLDHLRMDLRLEEITHVYAYLNSGVVPSVIAVRLTALRINIEQELRKLKFAFIKEANYFEQDAFFGISVNQSFPSTKDEIKAACNCIAADLPTAAVFHLMRVAEIGLRALARDRRITIPKKVPIDLATWKDIIRQLEVAEKAIEGYPKSLAREAQFEFYHGANLEFSRFKNVYRNQIMHVREDYDLNQAKSVLDARSRIYAYSWRADFRDKENARNLEGSEMG